jgi:hypothetical protein
MWYMHDGAPANLSRTVRDVLCNTYYNLLIGRGGPTASSLTRLECSGFLPVRTCMQLLLTMKRHFTIALWMPVRLSATTEESLNECGCPRLDVR